MLDGVQSLLEDLTDAGIALGLTTGGLEAAAHAKLGRGQLNHFFLVGGYGSDSEDRVALTRAAVDRGERLLGHALDLGEVFVVGDTPLDVAAAKGVGAVSVGVASGRYERRGARGCQPGSRTGVACRPVPRRAGPKAVVRAGSAFNVCRLWMARPKRRSTVPCPLRRSPVASVGRCEHWATAGSRGRSRRSACTAPRVTSI